MIGILHVLKYLMPLCCPIQKCTVGPPENELDIIYTPLIEELKLHNGKNQIRSVITPMAAEKCSCMGFISAKHSLTYNHAFL